MPQNDQALLTRLREQEVAFVLIGGVACIYHGAPISTFDVDIACRFDEITLRKIEGALRGLHPVHRLTPNKLPFELTPQLVSTLKNLSLQTDLGKLDCLSEVAGVGDYQAVLERTVRARFAYGEFRFLDLDALIDAKKAAGRDHDKYALVHLQAIKEKIRTQQ